MSSSSMPLIEAEREWFTHCNMNAMLGAMPPALVFGITAGRWVPPTANPLAKIAVGVGVGTAVFGGMTYLGKQTCVRDFASLPNLPTPVALRSRIRERDPSHWLVRNFDTKYPLHDSNALQHGATSLGTVPVFTPDADVMELLLKKGDGVETKAPREAAKQHDTSVRDARVAAAETARATRQMDSTRLSSPSMSDEMDPWSSSRQMQQQSQQSQSKLRAGWRGSSSDDSSSVRPSGEWGTSSGPQRKLKVRYNEFGDEIIEEQEMENN